MSYPVGTVAVCTTSDGSWPVWVKALQGWHYISPLTAVSGKSDITEADFDADWIFIQPENPNKEFNNE